MKCLMTLKPSNGFKLVYQPSYYKKEIKVTTYQADSIMTHNCELFQSEFSNSSSRLIKNESFAHI